MLCAWRVHGCPTTGLFISINPSFHVTPVVYGKVIRSYSPADIPNAECPVKFNRNVSHIDCNKIAPLTFDTTQLNDTKWHKLFLRTDSFVSNSKSTSLGARDLALCRPDGCSAAAVLRLCLVVFCGAPCIRCILGRPLLVTARCLCNTLHHRASCCSGGALGLGLGLTAALQLILLMFLLVVHL